MNHRFIASQLGLLLLVLSGLLFCVALWQMIGWWSGDESTLLTMQALLMTVGIGLLGGGSMWRAGHTASKDRFGRREALLLVVLSWILGAALAALPLRIWAALAFDSPGMHPFQDWASCYFEAMSGLTTTGATVLSDIEAVPDGLLFWRAMTQWLGGLGIVVLFVAVLPTVGSGGKKLFLIEAPGPAPTGVRPKIRDTARVLWMLYLGLTAAQTLALMACGLSFFDAICHTFTTLSTAGFSTKNASMAAFGPAAIWVTIFFMVVAGMNFGLFYRAIGGDIRSIWRDTETRVYLTVLAIGSTIVIMAVYSAGQPVHLVGGMGVEDPTLMTSIEHGLFTTVSLQTTTGYCTADYNEWPLAAEATLLTLMLFGGCAGSTAGGVKIIRVWVAFRVLVAELERVFNPNVVRPLRVGKAGRIDSDLKLSVLIYILGVLVLLGIGTISLMVIEGGDCDVETALSASLATLCTIGPGYAGVGPVENFGWLSEPSQIVMSGLMLLGRLEVFAVFVLFHPRFWKSN